MSTEEVHYSGGVIPAQTCKSCGVGMRASSSAHASRFTLQCGRCGLRLFVFTSSTAPLILIWRDECPPNWKFYDWVRQKMGIRSEEYLNTPRKLPTSAALGENVIAFAARAAK